MWRTHKSKAIKCRFCGEMSNAKVVTPKPELLSTSDLVKDVATSKVPPTWIAIVGKVFEALKAIIGGEFPSARRQNAAKPDQKAPSVWTRPINLDGPRMKAIWALLLIFIVGGFLFSMFFKKSTSNTASEAQVSGLTFADFDSKFSTESQTTDAQKDQMIDQYKGARVRWQGILENVDGDIADFQEKATTLTQDVSLEVAEEQQSNLTGLNKGDLVTYEGTIVDYGSLVAHRLDHGRIVDSKHLSPEDRITWLANSQTAALQPIVGSAPDMH